MAVDPLSVWKLELTSLTPVADSTWALNFANYVADRVVAIETNPSSLISTLVCPFNKVLFASQLVSLAPTPDAATGIAGFATAWETTILTNIFPATLSVAPGAIIPPASPATTFSLITSVILDPASIILAKNKILELISSPPVSDPNSSLFPEKFREAFLALTITIIGMDSTPTPTGPLPLVAANIPLF